MCHLGSEWFFQPGHQSALLDECRGGSSLSVSVFKAVSAMQLLRTAHTTKPRVLVKALKPPQHPPEECSSSGLFLSHVLKDSKHISSRQKHSREAPLRAGWFCDHTAGLQVRPSRSFEAAGLSQGFCRGEGVSVTQHWGAAVLTLPQQVQQGECFC